MSGRDIAVVSVSEVWDRREVFVRSLTDPELEIFCRLSVEKRQQEWLAGRVAAKRAVQKKVGLPFSSIEIQVEPNGRPRVLIEDVPSELFLSISHSSGIAAAIASSDPIGFDLEKVELREPSFESLVLTDRDRDRLGRLQGRARDEALTLLWCEKEAYAKLTGEGLRIPFAELEVPDDLRIERGIVDLGGVLFAFAVLEAPSTIRTQDRTLRDSGT